MLLLEGALRRLPSLYTGKLYFQCLIRLTSVDNVGRQQRRSVSRVAPIALSYDQYDGPNPDASRSPLITMHGLFGSKQNWRSVSRVLAKETNRRVYAVDMRNHGDSGHTNKHDSDGMTADLVAFLQSHSIAKTSLLGHSMGGRAAMHFALNNPELTDRLIIVDISPVSTPRSLGDMREILEAMIKLSVPASFSLSKGRQFAKDRLMDVIDAGSVDFIILNLRKKPQTGEFHWACNVTTLLESLSAFERFAADTSHLPAFTGPTTFICGTHSPYMNPEEWPEVLKVFPNASLYWLDTGHLVHLEEPAKFIAHVSAFLNEP